LKKEDSIEIKRLFVMSLSEKASEMANQVWEEKGWTNEDMDAILKEH
jgi:hypothetical protein